MHTASSLRPTALPRAALLPFVLLGTVLAASAQPAGTVTGTVVDAQTGETLIGVNVVVAAGAPEGALLGAATDLDGRYQLRLAPGTYALAFSYVGYDTQTIAGIEVRAGATTRIDVVLSPSALGLGEVVVQAEAVLDAEAGLLRVQARAPAILDGISAQQIRRSPDATSSEALRRITGVSIFGGRFAYVRGLPERYSGTLLNGSPVASAEPDSRAFAYDLVPSNLLDYITVVKTATPDLPGDFAGGMITLATVDFPERFTLGVGTSSGVVPGMTGSPFTYTVRGRTDFLGLDDGSRSLPAAFPRENLAAMPPEQLSAMQPELVQLVRNNWAPQVGEVAPPVSFSVSAGDATRIGRTRVGAVGALTYRSGYSTQAIVRRQVALGDFFDFDYAGQQSTYSVAWGGLFNVSVRPSDFHGISFRNLYTRTADDEFTYLEGISNENNTEERRYAMRFVARDVYSGQLIGDHFFPRALGRGLQLRWDLGRATVSRDDPDYRQLSYFRPEGTTGPFVARVPADVRLGSSGRYYGEMDEGLWSGALRLSVPLEQLRLTVGAAAERRDRAFTSRLLGAVAPRRSDPSLLQLPIDRIFAPENFRPGGFALGESRTGVGTYEAEREVWAAFAMADWTAAPISRRLRVVGGLRAERAVQDLRGVTFQGNALEVPSDQLDLLPSVNLTYSLDERTNARLAYSRNVNRPEFRELFPAGYYDFETQAVVFGNENLRRATIQNVDLRLETYPGPGQLLSASLFYKRFTDPIERAIRPGVALGRERTFRNADRAENWGVELEGRYGLGALHPYLRASSVLANLTWVRSDVTIRADDFAEARTGRPLQGQAPYIVNAGLAFVEPRHGTAVSVLYNRIGRRIFEVSTEALDLLEEPRDVLDLTLSQPLLNNRVELRLTARDVLAQPQRFTQEGVLVRQNERFASFGIGLSLRY